MIDLLHVPEWKWYQMTSVGRPRRRLRRSSLAGDTEGEVPGPDETEPTWVEYPNKTNTDAELETRVRKSVIDMKFDMVLFMIFRLIWIDLGRTDLVGLEEAGWVMMLVAKERFGFSQGVCKHQLLRDAETGACEWVCTELSSDCHLLALTC